MMMSLQEECDKIRETIFNDDVTTIQELLADDVDVINADVVDIWGVSGVEHNVCSQDDGTVNDIICVCSLVL